MKVVCQSGRRFSQNHSYHQKATQEDQAEEDQAEEDVSSRGSVCVPTTRLKFWCTFQRTATSTLKSKFHAGHWNYECEPSRQTNVMFVKTVSCDCDLTLLKGLQSGVKDLTTGSKLRLRLHSGCRPK